VIRLAGSSSLSNEVATMSMYFTNGKMYYLSERRSFSSVVRSFRLAGSSSLSNEVATMSFHHTNGKIYHLSERRS